MANYISYGMKGDNVKALQEQLNTYGGAGLQTDGIFGPKTKAALENFQKTSGITVDGIYGNQTAGVLTSLQTAQNSAQAPTTSSAPIGGQTTPLAEQTGIQPFNYDYSTDPLYKAQAGITQSQIAQQMAARGILGSTIDQERTAVALGSLGLDYKNQAYNQYTADRTYQTQQQRQIKEDAWTTAQERGYFNNEEARAWGLTPGTKTASAQAREAATAQAQADAQASAYNASVKSQTASQTANLKSVSDTFHANFAVDPVKAISLIQNMGLTQDELIAIYDYTPLDENGYSVWDYLDGTASEKSSSSKTSTGAIITDARAMRKKQGTR